MMNNRTPNEKSLWSLNGQYTKCLIWQNAWRTKWLMQKKHNHTKYDKISKIRIPKIWRKKLNKIWTGWVTCSSVTYRISSAAAAHHITLGTAAHHSEIQNLHKILTSVHICLLLRTDLSCDCFLWEHERKQSSLYILCTNKTLPTFLFFYTNILHFTLVLSAVMS